MSKRHVIILSGLGVLIAGLAATALVLGLRGGGTMLSSGTTTATVPAAPGSSSAPSPEPVETSPPETQPTTTQPPATEAPGTVPPTEPPPVTVPWPNYFPEGVERVANPIQHGEYADPDCDGLVLDYSPVAPRELRLPGEPIDRVRTVVIVDMLSEPASLEEAEYTLETAGEWLYGLTGFGFEMTEYVEAHPPDAGFIKAAIPHCYLQTVTDLPDHVVLFSYGLNDNALSFGGYATYLDARSPFASWAPVGWSNRFTNVDFGGVQMYISVIHWSHEFAHCGYGSSETPISDVAIDGECRNQAGQVCVAGPEYQICPDALSNPYAFRANFRASTVVHELMHPFGKYGNGDHVGAPECNAEMGYPEGYYDEEEGDLHHQMCPYTYDLFVQGFVG